MGVILEQTDLENINTGFLVRKGNERVLNGIITEQEALTFKGNRFVFGINRTNINLTDTDLRLADDGVTDFVIENPIGSGKLISFQYKIKNSTSGLLNSYYNPVLNGVVGAVIPFNLKPSGNAPVGKYYRENSFTGGTLRANDALLVGSNPVLSTPGENPSIFTILEEGEKFGVKITNRGGQVGNFMIIVEAFEIDKQEI